MWYCIADLLIQKLQLCFQMLAEFLRVEFAFISSIGFWIILAKFIYARGEGEYYVMVAYICLDNAW